jgi:hypothetical protein
LLHLAKFQELKVQTHPQVNVSISSRKLSWHIQQAADLQWPETDPANAGIRDRSV